MVWRLPSLSASMAVLAFVLAMASQSASAGARAWVSGKGLDAAGCGAPTQPCRSLQYVHDNIISAGGEIDILDPAGYGAVTITMALSIVNDGVGTAGVQAASGDAITINAGAGDAVHLRGLNIDGLGTGQNGVAFNSGASLTVVNCVVRHFAGKNGGVGIYIGPTSGTISFLVSNTLALDNSVAGVIYAPPSGSPTAKGVIDHVTTNNNGNAGIGVYTSSSSGGATNVTVSNSDASDNVVAGIALVGSSGAPIVANVDRSTANNNQYGIMAYYPVTLYLGRTVASSNQYGVFLFDQTSVINTYGDNRLSGNSVGAIFGAPTTDKPQ